MVDSYPSKLVKVVSGVPHGSVLDLLLFLLCTSEHFYILENFGLHSGFADDSTLMAVVPFPGVRITVAEFVCRDLVKDSVTFGG